MGNWIYALACVLLPVLWGLLIVGVTNGIERWAAHRSGPTPRAGGESDPPRISPEYHI